MSDHAAEIAKSIRASLNVKHAVLDDGALIAQIGRLTDDCLVALRNGNKIIFAGNGGSFADAQHLSAEFTSRFQFDRAPLPSLALATNNSAISAISNDYGYEQVFARELIAIAKAGDVYIPITTSGNSPNILESIKIANQIGLRTACLTGATGGQARELCECICMPSNITAQIQECHIMVGHIICGLLENLFFNSQEPMAGTMK